MAIPVLLLTLLIASATDFRSRVIPNWLVSVAALAGVALAGIEDRLIPAVLAGLLALAPFLLAAVIKPGGMGMGDVKLAGVMGLFLGQSVWIVFAVGLGLAGLSGVLISLGQRLPPTQTALPLAPFFALGAGIVLALGGNPLQ